MYAWIKKRLTAAVASVLTIAAPVASQAVTFVLTDEVIVLGSPTLIGVDGLDVNGVFYDVRFHDVTCFDLYNGCDDAFFPFENPDPLVEFADATEAMQALNTQVNGVFGGSPARVAACFDVVNSCEIALPIFTTTETNGELVVTFVLFPPGAGVGPVTNSGALASSNDPVWTTWDLAAVQAVPLPAPFWLLGSTFIFLFGMRAIRRRA